MSAPGAMRLQPLLAGLIGGPVPEVTVTGLALDSRQVRPGDLFVALPGSRTHGQHYIDAAVAAGAAAVLCDAGTRELGKTGVPCLLLHDLSHKLGLIAERFYGRPSQELFVIGVTGTNGKTSCSHFLAQALNEPTAPAAVIGTLGNGFIDRLEATRHTTPDAVRLHALLRDLADAGARSLVMEVSSHGLAQGRVAGVGFDLALFTNLSRDHLDYHGDMAAYGRAKARLFQQAGLRYAVLNGDDAFGRTLLAELPETVEALTYTLAEAGDPTRQVCGEIVSQGRDGLLLELRTPWGDGRLHSALLGRFNASNLLAVLSCLLLKGMGLETALHRLSRLRTVPGRMERFGGQGDQPLVVVDYAHTPDALSQVLITLREHCSARLWCVFGCGGDRDAGKRVLMGNIAARYADHTILTDDNPRHEDGDKIIDDIAKGMVGGDYVIMRDRAAAIRHAVGRAAANDVVLVAGKGHEVYQQVGDEQRPFSDRDQVCQALGVAA